MSTEDISRRALAGMTAGLGIAGLGFTGQTAAATAATPNALPTDPKTINDALTKIMGTTSKDRVVFSFRTIFYAVQPSGVQPIIGLRSTESGWWTKKDDNSWIRYSSTLSFFEDLETGKFIDAFKNPITGQTNKVTASFIRHKEGEYRTTTGEYYGSMKKAFPEVYKDAFQPPNWVLNGDIIRLQRASNYPPIMEQPSREVVSLFARASEVFNPKIATPSALIGGWYIRPWERWMDMGDTPGHVIGHFDGLKVNDVETLDRDYLERARAFTPLFDKSPEFDEGPSFFEKRLAAHQKPT